MKTKLTAIILITVLAIQMGCSSGNTPQEASSEASTGEVVETTEEEPEEERAPEQKKAYELYAEKIEELEQAYGPLTVDLYGYGVPDMDWRYAHGMILLKLIDFDKDGVEELIAVCANEAQIPVIRVYEAEGDALSGIYAYDVGGGGSPVIYQIGFGEYDGEQAIFSQAGSASCSIWGYDKGIMKQVGWEERKEGLVFSQDGMSYKMPSVTTRETYFFTYDSDEYQRDLDAICKATNETFETLGLEKKADYVIRDASKEQFYYKVCLRGDSDVVLRTNDEEINTFNLANELFSVNKVSEKYIFKDINGDGKDEMIIREGDFYVRVFVQEGWNVYELQMPFYSGSTGEYLCEDGTIFMHDDGHPGREGYHAARINEANEVETLFILSREYPDPMYQVPEETFAITENGTTTKLTEDEYKQKERELVDNVIESEYIPLTDMFIEAPVPAIDLAEMTASDIFDTLGEECFKVYYDGGFGYRYPDLGLIVFPASFDVKTLTADPDSAMTSVLVYGRYEVFPELTGGATWPEMKAILDREGISASAPEKKMNELNGWEEYRCTFEYDTCEFSCLWLEDPNTHPCLEIVIKLKTI